MSHPTYNTAHTIEDNGNIIQLYQDKEGYYKDNYPIVAQFDKDTKEVVCGYQIKDNFYPLTDVNYNSETKKFTYKDFTDENGRLQEYDILYADYIDENNAQIFESATNRLDLVLAITDHNCVRGYEEGADLYNISLSKLSQKI